MIPQTEFANGQGIVKYACDLFYIFDFYMVLNKRALNIHSAVFFTTNIQASCPNKVSVDLTGKDKRGDLPGFGVKKEVDPLSQVRGTEIT